MYVKENDMDNLNDIKVNNRIRRLKRAEFLLTLAFEQIAMADATARFEIVCFIFP